MTKAMTPAVRKKVLARAASPSIRQRIELEMRIADEVAKALIGHGYVLRVYDGEEFVTKRTTDPRLIADNMFETDEAILVLFRPDQQTRVGYVQFIYGNSGHDVVSDWTMNVDEIVQPIVEKYNV